MSNKMFSKTTLLLSISGLALNVFLVWLTDVFAVPLYLDSIGTIIVAALGGTLPGMAVGFLSNCITAFFAVSPDPMTLYYGFLSVFIAVAAAGFSKKGLFLKGYGRLIAILTFAAIGGALGSVVTWVLYGFSFGQGTSAPLTKLLYNNFNMGKFSAQFAADIGIDLLDKAISVAVLCVVLCLLSKNIFDKLPLGYVYKNKIKSIKYNESQIKDFEKLRGESLFRRRSIRTKFTFLIVISASVLSVVALIIGVTGYKTRLVEQYSDMCRDAVCMMLPKIDGDKITEYLENGQSAKGYIETENELYDILNNADKIKYMYVYSIRPDGCHVVFDLDTKELNGEETGTVLAFDESFPYIAETIAGKDIPPIVTDDTYGWLLTVYKPIKDSSGTVVAYAAADIDMQKIKMDTYSFFISIASLLLGMMMIITAFTLWYCDKNLLDPMGILVGKARNVNFDGNTDDKNTSNIQSVKTGDEIEEVFNAMCRTEDAITEYIKKLKEKNIEISRMQRNIIYTLANMVENRDESTGGHIKRTAEYVKLIANKLRDDGKVDAEYVKKLYDSAPLHDIGKVKIPDAILNKPGKLTAEEFDMMKCHTTEGANILRSSLSEIEDGSWLSIAVDMAHYHHERWDGTGYPEGLSGEAIPLCARIMSVSDVFDALVSVRSYKKAFPFEEAIKILKDGAGTQFDAQIVSVFVNAEKEIHEIMSSN